MRTCRILISLFIVTCIASLAHADRATEAKLRFEQGLKLLKKEQIEKGLNEMLISNRLAPNPNALLNAARALEMMELNEYAYVVYDEYLRNPNVPAEDRIDAERASAALARLVARLKIETHPPNVRIFVDKERFGDFGRSPREIAAKDGKHIVILKMKDYVTKRVEIDFKRGVQQNLSVALETRTGSVLFDTSGWQTASAVPKLAVHDKTGKLIGGANERIRLPVGKQTVKLSARGYKAKEIILDVVADEITPLADESWDDDWLETEDESDSNDTMKVYVVQLEPVKGSLRVLANKTGALIYLDDKEVGFTPKVVEAAVGRHDLRLELTGYKTWSGQFSIEHHEQKTVGEIEFRRPSASRLHAAWPWGLAGLSGVTLGVGFALAIQGKKANEGLSAYPSEIEVDRGNRYLMLADGAMVVSFLSALGSYFLFRNIKEASSTQPRARFYETNTELEALPPFEEMEEVATPNE